MTASTIAPPRFPRAAGIAVTAWLALTLVAGATGFFVRLPFPGPQLIFLALFAATLVAATSVPALRAWVDARPLRTLIGINALRFIGITFLVLAARGQIAPVFAARAGWGDIATAVLALVLLAAGEPRTPLHRGLAHAWNAFGLLRPRGRGRYRHGGHAERHRPGHRAGAVPAARRDPGLLRADLPREPRRHLPPSDPWRVSP